MRRLVRQKIMAGFTLLEVMIALAILGMSLTAISQSQMNSVRAANRAKWMTIAVMLARYKMVEAEDTLFEDGFSDFDDEDKGDFDDAGFKRFSYVLKIDKIELPSATDAKDALGKATDDSSSDDTSSPQSGMMAMGASIMSKSFELIRNTLEQSIRRVQLSVEWKEGSQTRKVTVVSYYTDPRKIDIAASGRLTPGAAGLPGTTKSTSTSTSTSSGTSTGSISGSSGSTTAAPGR